MENMHQFYYGTFQVVTTGPLNRDFVGGLLYRLIGSTDSPFALFEDTDSSYAVKYDGKRPEEWFE
ncbi:hypothetical protein HYX14_02540 [Candidatus Woesearchaeota archaeon]|nr:hypothetical protein [Candidatus Woesearchaeota archaeon]